MCHIRTISLIDESHIEEYYIPCEKFTLRRTMVRNSRIFSESNNWRKTRTSRSELELEYLDFSSNGFLGHSRYQKWQDHFIHFFIQLLRCSKQLDLMGCFYDTFLRDRTFLHHELHSIFFDLRTKRLCEEIWIRREIFKF